MREEQKGAWEQVCHVEPTGSSRMWETKWGVREPKKRKEKKKSIT